VDTYLPAMETTHKLIHITHKNVILIISIRDFSVELYVLPDDDMRCSLEDSKIYARTNVRVLILHQVFVYNVLEFSPIVYNTIQYNTVSQNVKLRKFSDAFFFAFTSLSSSLELIST
jgi:hypothetical protein